MQRRAASAKARTTRRMSASSISFGKLRWAGSRTDEAEIVGSQSPSSQTVRRPRWVSWTIVAVPWACIRSASCWNHGMMSSSPAYSWPKIGGESGATLVEPPNIDSAIPPLAFSSWYS